MEIEPAAQAMMLAAVRESIKSVGVANGPLRTADTYLDLERPTFRPIFPVCVAVKGWAVMADIACHEHFADLLEDLTVAWYVPRVDHIRMMPFI